jgi:hypothetical protein
MPMIDSTKFSEPGLYLVWPDGSRLDLTRKLIESHAQIMLDDPSKIPPQVRAAADYQPCDICPKRNTVDICHAIMTALPFIDDIDRYMSYDRILAVFREERGGFHATETTMQDALKYVSILALTQYCEVGRKYSSYFQGVNPLMPASDIAVVAFRNIHTEAHGDMAAVEKIIHTMQEELLHTTRCQMARLRLISNRDAFLNAFVATYNTAELLFTELRKRLREEDSR